MCFSLFVCSSRKLSKTKFLLHRMGPPVYGIYAGSFEFCFFPLKFQPLPILCPPGAVVSSHTSSLVNKPQLSAGKFHSHMQPSHTYNQRHQPPPSPALAPAQTLFLSDDIILPITLAAVLSATSVPSLSLVSCICFPSLKIFPLKCLAHLCHLASSFCILPMCWEPC